jgi:hypothetical protein
MTIKKKQNPYHGKAFKFTSPIIWILPDALFVLLFIYDFEGLALTALACLVLDSAATAVAAIAAPLPPIGFNKTSDTKQ